jgi:hypothetical protein
MENQAFIFQGRPYLSLLFYHMYIHKNNGPKYHVKLVTYQLLSHDKTTMLVGQFTQTKVFL